jgi:hypothetical protein
MKLPDSGNRIRLNSIDLCVCIEVQKDYKVSDLAIISTKK